VDLGSGVAIDIGAHIGGVSVALALDNPGARVIAVEALSANVELAQHNIERNGVAGRVTLLHAAASKKRGNAQVKWNFDGSEAGQHHRFIANAHGIPQKTNDVERVKTVTLADLGSLAGQEIAFAKVDCELCEYDFLDTASVGIVQEFRGEFHAGFDQITHLLGETHHVSLTSGTESFGAFSAVRKLKT